MSQKKEFDLNSKIPASKFRKLIVDNYGSIYAYAKAFGFTDNQVHDFLNKKGRISFKMLTRHCYNLGIKVEVNLTFKE